MDSTERPIQRLQDAERQTQNYSPAKAATYPQTSGSS
jgi:hypothetical protein